MSTINLNYEFRRLDGEPITDGGSGKPGTLNLQSVVVQSLLTHNEQQERIDGNEKFKRYLLAMKVNAKNEVDDKGFNNFELTSEEVTLIKNLVGKYWNPLIVGQAFEALEGKEPSIKKPAKKK